MDEDLSTLLNQDQGEPNNQQPGKWGPLVYLLLFLAFFILFMVISEIFIKKHRQIQKARDEIRENQQTIKQLEEKNRVLQQKIQQMKTAEGQDRAAREKLKLILPDEFIVEWEENDD